AFELYGQAAMLDILAKMLPELAKQIAQPMSGIEKITVVDSSGNGDGAAKVSNYVTKLMAQTPEMVKQVSGIDLNQMLKNFSEQQKTSKPINVTITEPSKLDDEADSEENESVL